MNQITYRTLTTIKDTEKSHVVLAMMEDYEDPVIIKRLKNANSEVYRMLSEIDSVHIPHIYAWECQEEELVVAEEYVDGETLEFYLEQGKLTEEQKLFIALQLCEAVEVLHSCKPQIIHRDIKPSNVLITEEGVLKLIDFDASRQYKRLSENSDTRILGTADYAAPEQFGYKQTDMRSDIYSMGIVFEMMGVQVKGAAVWAWKRVLDVCTNFDPKRRYKNVPALVKDIRKVMNLQKYQWWYLCSVVCVMVVIALGVWWLLKPAETTGEFEGNQVLAVTPEASATIAPTVVPTDIPVPTATSTPVPTLPALTSNEGATEEQLAQIKQELEEKSYYVNCYHLGENAGEDLLLYSDMFEQSYGFRRVILTDLASGEELYLSADEYEFENSIFYLTAEYMQTLRSSYYRLQLEYSVDGEGDSVNLENHIRVYSASEPFKEGQYALQGNYLLYRYEEYEMLHAVLRADAQVKISAVYVGGTEIPKEQYKLLYDGRGIEFSKELLEQCKNCAETMFEVEFDDGRREVLTIANPYL